MPDLSITSLVAVVEQLPLPLILATADGIVVAANAASYPLIGDVSPGTPLEHRFDDDPTTTHHHVDADGAPHVLLALSAGTGAPAADAAALARATAHDFNNLLGVIINFTSLAAAQLPAGSGAVQDLHEVLVASRRAATLTNRLLQIAATAPERENG
jgi:signal transduction histidine kinase